MSDPANDEPRPTPQPEESPPAPPASETAPTSPPTDADTWPPEVLRPAIDPSDITLEIYTDAAQSPAEREAAGKEAEPAAPPAEAAEAVASPEDGSGPSSNPQEEERSGQRPNLLEEDGSGQRPNLQEAEALEPAVVREMLEARRAGIVAHLFTEQQSTSPAVQQLFDLYAATLRDAAALEIPAELEVEKLLDEARTAHLAALAGERNKLDEARKAAGQWVAAYQRLFAALGPVVEAAGAEVQRLNEADPRLAGVGEELRASLLNFRRGVEIIHRMFSRAVDRKKPLVCEVPVTLVDELVTPKPPDEIAALDQFARALSNSYRKARDANYHLLQDARKHVDSLQQASITAAKAVLGAIDGVDSGLATLPETRTHLAQTAAEPPVAEVMDDWLGVYGRLDAIVTQFLEQSGLRAHTAQRGVPFDPETMEPQGTVAAPDLPEESVAAVARRGFSLGDVPVRPMLVDVVKNG